MPQPFEGAIMTDGGIALLTKAQAGECKITFTKMVIGNGEYSDEEKTTEALQARTALKSERNSYTVSSVAVYNATTVRVTALLSNEDPYTGKALINDGYYINEIGLYGKETDGDEGTEVLYSIAVTSGGQGDYMPAYNGSNPAQITQRYYATVANSLEVTVEVTNDEFVLKEDYDTEVAELTEKNAELEAKSAELEAKNAELEEKITELNDNLNELIDDTTLKSGDSIRLDSVSCCGYITTSRTQIWITIPIGKTMRANPSLNLNAIRVRCNGTYLISVETNAQSYIDQYLTISYVVDGFAITICLTNSDGWSDSLNNYPLSAQLDGYINFI